MTGRRLVRIAGALAAIVVLGMGAGILRLRTSLPDDDAVRTVDGLTEAVEVLRDANGVPHIFAAGEADAAFALGFVHAEDRLWQMEAMRRLGSGRLAEILGERPLASDRLMRTLGLHRLAEAQAAAASPQLRRTLDAYAAGVNAWLDGRRGALPPEFQLLGVEPERWRPADSLVWGKLMAWVLGTNRHDELRYARLAARLAPHRLAELWPPPAVADVVTVTTGAGLVEGLAVDALEAADDAAGGRGRGASNAWAVAGHRSGTGKPLLANDPHLPFRMPGSWYLARLVTPQRETAGATAPGVPLVVLGHNGGVAWGFTTTGADTEDLFVEEVDPADPGRYRTPDGWARFAVRDEVVRRRDGGEEVLTVRSGRHGPVISDAVPVPAAAVGGTGGRVLALAAPYLDTDDRTPEAFVGVSGAADCRALVAALADFHAPAQNVFCADTAGSIAMAAAGRVPVRRSAAAPAPVAGWTGAHDWIGVIPADRMPRAIDPPEGVLVNANNRLVGDDFGWYLGRGWDHGYRARRILDVLAEAKPHTADAALRLQQDTLSLMVRYLLPPMLERVTQRPALEPALELLAGWDGRMDRRRPEPLLFLAWLGAFHRTLFADELGDDFARLQGPNPELIARVLAGAVGGCDGPSAPACGEMLASALAAAIADLAPRHGDDPRRWAWGDAHRARFRHGLFGSLPVVGPWFDPEIATDGCDFTVNRGSMDWGHPETPFAHVHGAGFRAVYDLADLARSRFMVAPGQSGNPLSPNYADLLRPWRDGAALTLGGDRDTVARSASTRLVLLPAGR